MKTLTITETRDLAAKHFATGFELGTDSVGTHDFTDAQIKNMLWVDFDDLVLWELSPLVAGFKEGRRFRNHTGSIKTQDDFDAEEAQFEADQRAWFANGCPGGEIA